MYTHTFRHQLFVSLFRKLEAGGISISTAQHLQVQELVRRTQEELSPEDWRDLLSPILTTTPQAQQQFYSLFEQSLKETVTLSLALKENNGDSAHQDQIVEELEKKQSIWARISLTFPPLLFALASFTWSKGLQWYQNPGLWIEVLAVGSIIIALHFMVKTWRSRLSYLALIIVFGLFGWAARKFIAINDKPKKPLSALRFVPFSVVPGDTIKAFLGPERNDTTHQIKTTHPKESRVSSLDGKYSIDTNGVATYIASPYVRIGQIDTLLLILNYKQGNRDSVYWIGKIIEEAVLQKVDTGLVPELVLPYPKTDSLFESLQIDSGLQARYFWYLKYERTLKLGLLLLLGGLVIAIAMWDKYRNAKAAATLKRPDQAPYLWNLRSGIDAVEYIENDIKDLMNLLRGRSPDERLLLNLPLTIHQTIKAGGRIQFRYKHPSLPRESLLFIDRLDTNDHRAQLFDTIYQGFVKAEAPVSRYFYEGDPRLCFNEAYPEGIGLVELLYRYPGAQLLFIGDGQGLISQLSGKVATWTNLLESFPRKALLLTRPLLLWGRREQELQQLLPVMPATPEGLATILRLFSGHSIEFPSLGSIHKWNDGLKEPFHFNHDLLADLRQHFSPIHIDWIAACAIWPTLHWDLTLHLGTVLQELNPEYKDQLLSFKGIRELTRLPWFVEGRIPDSARLVLVEYLEKKGLEQVLRQSLHQLLQQLSPPFEDATAYDDYRMNLILNELRLNPTPEQQRKLEREFAQYLAAGKNADYVALKLLNRPKNSLDVIIKGPLKKLAFREGLPGLGWNLFPKMLGIWLLLGVVVTLFNPKLDPCSGQKVTYQERTYCLQDNKDRVLYLEQLLADAIELQDHSKVDSLITLSNSLINHDTAFYLNSAIRYYNYAARSFNCTKRRNPICGPISADNLRKLACFNFGRGGNLYQDLMNQQGIQYALGQQRACQDDSTEIRQNFVLSGRVVDENFQWPIERARVQIGNKVAYSNEAGQYRFVLDGASLANLITVRVQAEGFVAAELKITPQNQLPPIKLIPISDVSDREEWSKAEAINSFNAYQTYLERFPNGLFSKQAKNRLDALESSSSNDNMPKVRVDVLTFEKASEESSAPPLFGCKVNMYQKLASGRLKLLEEKSDENGYAFSFSLNPGGTYVVEAFKSDHMPSSNEFKLSKELVDQLGDKLEISLYLKTGKYNNGGVYLYFDNARPGPENLVTTTENYDNLYRNYFKREPEFSGFSGMVMRSFFQNTVKQGYDSLLAVETNIARDLEEGLYVKMYMTGYAAPVEGFESFDEDLTPQKVNTEYGRRLATRRMVSIINSLKLMNNGVLKKYIDSGQLSFELEPVGNDLSSSRIIGVSSLKSEIFGIQACLDRKVHIQKILTSKRPFN